MSFLRENERITSKIGRFCYTDYGETALVLRSFENNRGLKRNMSEKIKINFIKIEQSNQKK